MEEVQPHLSAARRRKVKELQAELATSKKVPEDLQSVDLAKAVKVSRIDQVLLAVNRSMLSFNGCQEPILRLLN
jgi:hypothetical protein